MAQYILRAPLIRAIKHNRLDVMRLLIEHGADLEVEEPDQGTAIFLASSIYNVEAVKLLLENGADVNHRRKDGETLLFRAILVKQLNLVELLLSHNADVNVFVKYKDKHERWLYGSDGFSPLHVALTSFRYTGDLVSQEHFAPHFAAHLAILKLLVPRCDSFDLIIDDRVNSTYRTEPCVVHFFQTELELGWDDDFTTTKYLLRNGAAAKFSQFYDCLFECTTSFKPLTASFLQLLVLAGCAFNGFTEVKTKERTCNQLMFDEYIQPVLDKIKATDAVATHRYAAWLSAL